MNKSELRIVLEEAFGDVPYPGDDNIGSATGRDDAETVAELYRGKDWRSLEPDELWGPGLHFMTPEALHYFLPAFLLASNQLDDDSLYSVLRPYRIRPHTLPDEEFNTKFANYTAAQKKVVREWIEAELEKTIAYDREEGQDGSDQQTFLSKLREYWF